MSYGKLVEGNRLQSFVNDTPILPSFLNELQDQLLASLKDRDRSALPPTYLSGGSTVAWSSNRYEIQLGGGGNNSVHHLYVRSGQKINSIRFTLAHAGANAAGGHIRLYSQLTTPSAGAMPAAVQEAAIADPWNTGGSGTYYTSTMSPAITVAPKTTYYLDILGQTGMVCYVDGIDVHEQFGN